MSNIETPKLIKIEHHYQIVRTALNIVGIILMVVALVRLNALADDNHKTLDQINANQKTLLCIVRESTNPKYTTIDPKTFKFTIDNSYIDRCVDKNK